MSPHDVVFGFGAHTAIDDGPELLRLVQQADRDGLDVFSLSDHPYIGDRLDAYATVGFVLGRTERISGFANVTNLPTRPAPMLARMVTSLAALSGGRVVLGMGAGGLWDRISDMGVARLSPGDAVDAFEEAIVLVRLLSGGGPPVTHRGRHYRVAQIEPAPVAAPPVWTGSVGPRSLAATGRVADGWIPGHAADWLSERYRESRPVIDEAAAAVGRDPREIRTIFNLPGRITERSLGATRDRAGPLDRRFRRPVGRRADRCGAGAQCVWLHALPGERQRPGRPLPRPLGRRDRPRRTRGDREGARLTADGWRVTGVRVDTRTTAPGAGSALGVVDEQVAAGRREGRVAGAGRAVEERAGPVHRAGAGETVERAAHDVDVLGAGLVHVVARPAGAGREADEQGPPGVRFGARAMEAVDDDAVADLRPLGGVDV